jgi:signal peptidase II
LGEVYYFVVDFIDFTLIDFAVFNGADSFVCVGAGLMILSLILEMKEEIKKEKAAKEAALSEKSSEEDI